MKNKIIYIIGYIFLFIFVCSMIHALHNILPPPMTPQPGVTALDAGEDDSILYYYFMMQSQE